MLGLSLSLTTTVVLLRSSGLMHNGLLGLALP